MRLRCLPFLAFAVCSAANGSQLGTAGVPAIMLKKLQQSVNVTRWFCYEGNNYSNPQYKNYLKAEDFADFKRLGITGVRLCLSPEAVYAQGKFNRAHLPFVTAALGKFNRAGMAVIFDLHDNGQLKLDEPGHDNSGFISFWQDAARLYRGKYETTMSFELVNEPQFLKNPEVWYALQKKTVRAIRAIDPKRTIMVSGNSWSGIDNMLKLPVLRERNLIYTCHSYDPFTFTHQGASWTGPKQMALKNIPFPSSPEAVAAMIDQIPAQYQNDIRAYGQERLGQSYLLGRIKLAREWGNQHHVPIFLGEFGAYPPVSPPDSRAAWFRGMLKAVKTYRMARAIWGYDDAMGLGRKVDSSGHVVLDKSVEKNFYNR